MGLSAKATFRPRDDIGRFVEARVTPAVRASVEASCDLIEKSAKLYAPVRTGALRDSITTEINDQGATIVGTVAPHVPYAEFVEFGTYKMAAQSFMRPALDSSREAIKEIFRDQISLAIKS